MSEMEQSTPNLRKVGNAKFDALRNDLFWSYHHYTNDLVWLKLDWYGYNDQNWWNNVAPTEGARAKVGQDGKNTYETDDSTYEERAAAEALLYEYMWQPVPSGKEYDIKVEEIDE